MDELKNATHKMCPHHATNKVAKLTYCPWLSDKITCPQLQACKCRPIWQRSFSRHQQKIKRIFLFFFSQLHGNLPGTALELCVLGIINSTAPCALHCALCAAVKRGAEQIPAHYEVDSNMIGEILEERCLCLSLGPFYGNDWRIT